MAWDQCYWADGTLVKKNVIYFCLVILDCDKLFLSSKDFNKINRYIELLMYQPLRLFGFSLSTLFNWSNLYRMPASQIDWNVFYYYVRWRSGDLGRWQCGCHHHLAAANNNPLTSASISISGISLRKLDLTVGKLLCVTQHHINIKLTIGGVARRGDVIH